jgi:LemA protein
MLKLSNDSAEALQHANVSSGLVLAEIGRMAQRFPELKSNQQYNRLMDSVNLCERDVQNSRLAYNERARRYNTLRSSLPTVLYATTIGFGLAEYLSMQAEDSEDAGIQKAPINEDSQRLNDLLGSVGKRTFRCRPTFQLRPA